MQTMTKLCAIEKSGVAQFSFFFLLYNKSGKLSQATKSEGEKQQSKADKLLYANLARLKSPFLVQRETVLQLKKGLKRQMNI